MREDTREKRVRKINADDLWCLVIFRAVGLSQEEIAGKLGVKQEAISYHLRQLKRRIIREPGKTYDIFIDIVLDSEKGTRTILGGINQRLYESYRQKKFGPRRK